MNNRHVLRLFYYIRNGLSHETSTTTLQGVVVKGKDQMYIKHISLQSICWQNCKQLLVLIPTIIVHPEQSCKLALDWAISAMHKNIHYKCSTAPFQWEMHSDLECKVGGYTYSAHIKYERLLMHTYMWALLWNCKRYTCKRSKIIAQCQYWKDAHQEHDHWMCQ